MNASYLRRDFLRLAARAAAGWGAGWSAVRATEELPPVRAITRGPLYLFAPIQRARQKAK